MSGTSLQAILRASYAEYARRHRQPKRVHRAIRALSRCRTAALGGHSEVCANGHVAGVWYNSCRHRSCPQCALSRVDSWLERKKALLPPVGYRHLTFTLPHEYLPLWRWNRRLMAELLFDSAWSTIRRLVSDPRWCGGLPGVLMGLHTWSRQLLLHPHVHALVTEGGSRGGEWRSPKKSIFVPTEVLRAVFKGKFQQRLERRIRCGAVRLPPGMDQRAALKLMKRAGEQEWIVDRRSRYEHGGGVATYLARYMRGGPLRNQQLIEAGPEQVRFRYVRDKGGREKSAQLTLTVEEFLRRFLEHIPVPGMHLVRAFGLFHPQHRAALERLHRSQAAEAAPALEVAVSPPLRACRQCGAPLRRTAIPGWEVLAIGARTSRGPPRATGWYPMGCKIPIRDDRCTPERAPEGRSTRSLHPTALELA